MSFAAGSLNELWVVSVEKGISGGDYMIKMDCNLGINSWGTH